jgi:membrane-associated protease RseP (regulator of RpoE activity)
MLNLVPFGQLDGGHILYALIGERAGPWGQLARFAILGWFVFEVCWFVGPVLLGSSNAPLSQAVLNAMPWLIWFGLLTLMTRLPGGGRHPPTDDSVLSRRRSWVGWGCLLLFAALFMPTPMAAY